MAGATCAVRSRVCRTFASGPPRSVSRPRPRRSWNAPSTTRSTRRQLPGKLVRGEGKPGDLRRLGQPGLRRARRDLAALLVGLPARLARRRGAGADRVGALPGAVRQRVLGRPADGLRRRRRQLLQRFTSSVDVIGHELTHGVTQFTAGLTYVTQSGALNESLSDCFGSMVKQQVARSGRGGRGLADRRGTVHGEGQRGGAALDEGAGHRLRRPGARQGPAAGRHGRLRQLPPTRSTTTAGCTPTPASPTGRSTSPPPASAGRAGRAPGSSGTTSLTGSKVTKDIDFAGLRGPDRRGGGGPVRRRAARGHGGPGRLADGEGHQGRPRRRPAKKTAKKSDDYREEVRPEQRRSRAQNPRRCSCFGSRCQSLAILTCRSR